MIDPDHRKRMQRLAQLLREHDWFYNFSDDNRVWTAGMQSEALIKGMVKACGEDGQRLYEAYCDINFHPGSGFSYQQRKSA